MKLPRVVGDWIGDTAPVSAKERQVLAKDTQFARKLYYNLAGDQIFVSIVLSGEDMTNSIHRPERCLPAQGLTVMSSQKRVVTLADGRSLELTKLGTAGQFEDQGKATNVRILNYYWFIGYRDMTASHLTRTWIDLRDRILHGYNQRWAYITVAANLNQFSGRHTEKETSEMIEGFIRELAPHLRRPDGSALF
jgi:EpsI family protein